MSNDMSVFKKMKERITDEVNSATNKLQNMQLMDQLTPSMNRQAFATPNQLLPEPNEVSGIGTMSNENQFSLLDDGPNAGASGNIYNEEEELNSDLSPQQQLFNEDQIKRSTSPQTTPQNKMPLTVQQQRLDELSISAGTKISSRGLSSHGSQTNNIEINNCAPLTVIKVDELRSDIDDELEDSQNEDDSEDVELDLLSDKPDGRNEAFQYNSNLRVNQSLSHYKTKYRNIVYNYRRLNKELDEAKNESANQSRDLKDQIVTLKNELDNLKQQHNTANQHDSLLSVSTSVSESDRSRAGSPQSAPTKASTKIKDLERLLAKCKESLKQKNSQIATLKESLFEVEKFKDYNQELRKELNELKEAHETWTVSIAENKRVMHQEIEDKNAEMEKLKSESNDLQLKLNDSNNKIRQLKSAIQDLESRLVSTSAAHQKERESLTKELTSVKNNAIKQLRKEHEHNIERVKLDLEKSIEGLKAELLNKDEQLIKSAEKFQQELHELSTRLDLMTTANDDQEKEIKSLKKERDMLNDSQKTIKSECDELIKKNESLSRVISDNETDIQANQDQLDNLASLEKKLDNVKRENTSLLEDLNQLKSELGDRNADIMHLRNRVEELEDSNARIIDELDETNKARENVIKERETLIAQTEALHKAKKAFDEQLVVRIIGIMKNLETPNTSPGSDKSSETVLHEKSSIECNQVKKELPDPMILMEELSSVALDRCASYMTASQRLQAVLLDNSMLGEELHRLRDELNNLNREKTMETQCSIQETERLRTENQALIHDQYVYDEKIKELEMELSALESQVEESKIAKEDKINQTCESDDVSREKQLESICKLREEEIEKLNSLLVQKEQEEKDQEDHIEDNRSLLESYQQQIEDFDEKLHELESLCEKKDQQLDHLKQELQNLKELRAESKVSRETDTVDGKNNSHDTSMNDEIPDSTQYEYLKNIVYQFMLGKEPLVLARVISVILKFNKSQVDQICKIQEAVQSALRQSN